MLMIEMKFVKVICKQKMWLQKELSVFAPVKIVKLCRGKTQ